MLELAQCRECGEVKPCIAFRGFRDGKPVVSHYCPECDEELEEWLGHEVDQFYSAFKVGGVSKGSQLPRVN